MYPGEDYTCAYQSCDPSPCAEGEKCIIQESYPPIVTCTPPDGCSLECSDFQVCWLLGSACACCRRFDENRPGSRARTRLGCSCHHCTVFRGSFFLWCGAVLRRVGVRASSPILLKFLLLIHASKSGGSTPDFLFIVDSWCCSKLLGQPSLPRCLLSAICSSLLFLAPQVVSIPCPRQLRSIAIPRPHRATPRHATPRHATPRHATPRPFDQAHAAVSIPSNHETASAFRLAPAELVLDQPKNTMRVPHPTTTGVPDLHRRGRGRAVLRGLLRRRPVRRRGVLLPRGGAVRPRAVPARRRLHRPARAHGRRVRGLLQGHEGGPGAEPPVQLPGHDH